MHRSISTVTEEDTVQGYVWIHSTCSFAIRCERLIFSPGQCHTNQPQRFSACNNGRRLIVVAAAIVIRSSAVVVASNGACATIDNQRVAFAIKSFFSVGTTSVIRCSQSVVVTSRFVIATRAKRHQFQACRQSRCRVVLNLINPEHRLIDTHCRVQCQLRCSNTGSVRFIHHLCCSDIPPLPWSRVERLCWRSVYVVIHNRVQSIPSLVAQCSSRIGQTDFSKCRIVIGGIPIDFRVDVIST